MNSTMRFCAHGNEGSATATAPPALVVHGGAHAGDCWDLTRRWILTTGDRALSAKSQRRSIEALGGVRTIIEMHTCHT
ncbi:MAG TPA: hypothetical protein VFK56_03395 [Mycobacterium sp.]|nr:hypothetical protein [Mycobacterium sp.]